MKRLLPFLFAVILTGAALADDCITSGYVFFHNGSAVPAGTPVRLTNLDRPGADYNVSTYTFMGADNYYLQVVFCVQSAGDRIKVHSNVTPWNKTVQYNSVNGVSQYRINLTYDNIPPLWNASLPDQTLMEDDLSGITGAFNLSNYIFDYDNQPLSFSIFSQSNPSLVSASLNGSMVNISRPTANSSGSSNVCIRAFDTENYSNSNCFTITVTAVPDNPAFNSAADNFSGTYIAEGRTIRITTAAFDGDQDQVTLYVCNSQAVSSAGCGDTQFCTATSLTNPTCSFITPLTEINHTWYAYIYDATGRIAPQNYSDSFFVDSQAPSPGIVIINKGDIYSSSTTVLVNWSGFTDSVTGIRYYYYSTINGQGTQAGTQVSNSTYSAMLSLPEGASNIYVWAEDFLGHIGLAASDSIIVDSIAPVISGQIQSPANLTDASGPLTFTVTITDTSLQGLPQYRYNLGGGGFGSWLNMTSLGGNQYRFILNVNWSIYSLTAFSYEVRATDYFNRTTTTTYYDYIERENLPPSFVPIGDFIVAQDSPLSFTLIGTDPNTYDNLTFTASCCFSVIPLDYRRATAYWIPTNQYVGQNTIYWNVTDGFNVASTSHLVTVLPVNDRPSLNPIGLLSGYVYQPFISYFTATDPDNENSYALDNNNLTFSAGNNTWFKVYSYYNSTGGNYYGVANFTPLLSHTGYSFLTLYVTDGTDSDSQNFTVYIGFCGDKDAAGQPRCDSDYESCSTCPTDCGVCGSTARDGYRMTILVNPRNCLNESFVMRAFELWNRATCSNMGIIVDGFEVCGNISGASITAYRFEGGKWVELNQYETDSQGRATFIPELEGEYKLVGKKRGYPDAIKYLEIRECLDIAEKNTTIITEAPAPEQKPQKEKPAPTKDGPDETTEEASVWLLLIYLIAIPTLIIILAVSGYYYYDNNKNSVAWILKARIWFHQRKRMVLSKAKALWKKAKGYLGYN